VALTPALEGANEGSGDRNPSLSPPPPPPPLSTLPSRVLASLLGSLHGAAARLKGGQCPVLRRPRGGSAAGTGFAPVVAPLLNQGGSPPRREESIASAGEGGGGKGAAGGDGGSGGGGGDGGEAATATRKK